MLEDMTVKEMPGSFELPNSTPLSKRQWCLGASPDVVVDGVGHTHTHTHSLSLSVCLSVCVSASVSLSFARFLCISLGCMLLWGWAQSWH
jgi:hypothetical protein